MKKAKLVIVTVLMILGMVVFTVLGQKFGLAQPLSNAVAVLDNVVAKPFQFLEKLRNDVRDTVYVYQENQSLKASLYERSQNDAELDSLKTENDQLRKMLEMKEKNKAPLSITGDVTMRSPLSWLREVSLNVGGTNGVKKGMLAVGPGGLVGSVLEVTDHASQISLLTNAENEQNISVKLAGEKESLYGIIVGYDEEKDLYIISQLNSSESIKTGAQVVTSGLGDQNVADIPVGVVESVVETKDHLNRKVYVKPSANLADLRVLTLVGN